MLPVIMDVESGKSTKEEVMGSESGDSEMKKLVGGWHTKLTPETRWSTPKGAIGYS